MPRSLSLTDAQLTANEIEFFHFIKCEFSTGTEYFTDYPGGYTEAIASVSATWIETDFKLGMLSQSIDNLFTINSIEFANLTFDWTNRAYASQLKNVQVSIFEAWFSTADGSLLDSFSIYRGRFDDGEFKDSAGLTLKSHFTSWDQPVPWTTLGGNCINDYRNELDCQYAGAEPLGQITCGKIRVDCALRGNEININIFERIPKAGEQILYGGVKTGLPPAPEVRNKT